MLKKYKPFVKKRESSFELLRIIAQLFIVAYHIFLVFIYPNTHQPLHKAIWLPLHIGVVLFVLISGYFGIKASVTGFIKLIGMVTVYYIPLQAIYIYIYEPHNINLILKSIVWITSSPYWYIKTYVFLYLFSPVINKYLLDLNLKNRIILILILLYISHYTGTLGLDPSLLKGKNLPCFLFLYVIGDTLRVYKHKWIKLRNIWGIIWIILNCILVVIFTFYTGRFASVLYSRVFFSYCSVGLLLSSVLFFMWIGGMSFRSIFINHIAKSSLAIYMIHGATISIYKLIGPFTLSYLLPYNYEFILFCSVILLSIIIVAICVLIDNILNPVWKVIGYFGIYCQNLWDKITFAVIQE